MVQSAGGGPRLPKGVRRPLVIKLKPGWRYESAGRKFVCKTGRSLRPSADLPKGSRISYMIPSLQRVDPKKLSADERDLARYIHIILPKGTEPAKHLRPVREWDCVDEAYVQPEVSLP